MTSQTTPRHHRVGIRRLSVKGRRILTVEIMGGVAVWLFMILTRAVPAAVVGVRYRWSAEHPGREPERMTA